MTDRYDTLFKEATAEHLSKYNYDWRLLKAQGIQESQLDLNAKSPAGALGLMQFMPLTWEEWSKKSGYLNTQPTDPEAAIYTAACYMKYLIKQWSSPRPEIDRYCLAMASYNAGLGNILQAQEQARGGLMYASIIKHLHLVTGDHSRETVWYCKKILGYYSDLVTG